MNKSIYDKVIRYGKEIAESLIKQKYIDKALYYGYDKIK